MPSSILEDRVKRTLKLTGGSFSGKRLYVPARGVRPATNLVREAVFSTLDSLFTGGVEGLLVLDLFAGTGSMGLEALSRGVLSVTFVEKDDQAVKSIRKNLTMLHFSARVVKSDVISFLKKEKYCDADIIFMDPPYRYTRCAEVVAVLVGNNERRNLTSVLVYERFFQKEAPDFVVGAHLLKRKKYGQTELLYYRI